MFFYKQTWLMRIYVILTALRAHISKNKPTLLEQATHYYREIYPLGQQSPVTG